jgi:arylsulfatase A-like enzyme
VEGVAVATETPARHKAASLVSGRVSLRNPIGYRRVVRLRLRRKVNMMDRRSFLLGATQAAAGAALAAGAGTAAGGAQPGASERPNVIWLIADQHRAQALGCNGDPNAHTPNIDALAAQGVSFTSAVSGFPLCCPFRGSLLASRYPHHCVPGNDYGLPLEQQTIVTPLKQAGYQTAWFGKWHLDGFNEREGRAAMHIVPVERRRGFDYWAAYENNNSQFDCWVHGGSGKDAFHYRLPGYETDELANLLIRYINGRAGEARRGPAKPFFAALSVQPPHDPFVAPAEFMGRYNGERLELRPNVPPVARVRETARRELAGYYAMIENWDWNIGRIRAALDKAGLAFNTHLMIFSDHGDMHGSHGQYRKRLPYEESMRVPFIIAGERPMNYDGRRVGRVPALVNHVDIAPTTLGLCGIGKPAWMEGNDYSHYRVRENSPASEPDSAYLQVVDSRGGNGNLNKPYRGLVTSDGWKYACFDNTSWLMFNLNEDPYELVNVAHDTRYRSERKRLIARLRQWIADTGDKFRVPED